MELNFTHLLLFLYFTVHLFKIMRNIPSRLTESGYREYITNSKKNIEAHWRTVPDEYRDIMTKIICGVSLTAMICHAVLCMYVGVISPYIIPKIICYLESVETFYTIIAHGKAAYEYLFKSNSYEFPYHKYEEWFGTVLGMLCCLMAIVTLILI